MTNLYVGSFDAANSTASIGYRQSDPDLEINAPAAEVVWENNGSTELALTAKTPPPSIEIPEGWIVVEQTTEPPQDIDFIHLASGIDIQIDVAGRPLPVRGDVTQAAAAVKLYWYDTQIGLQQEEIPVDVAEGQLGLFWNTHVMHASIRDFPEAPSWANFVKIEVEAIDGENVSNNSVLLEIETWEASDTVTPVEITEDQVLNGLLGSIMHISDSSDPDVRLYAYAPKSVFEASVQVTNDEGAYFYDPRGVTGIQELRQGDEVNDVMDFIAVKYQSIYSPAAHVVLLVGANDLPIVTNEQGETFSDQTLTFFPAANDHDIDRDDFVVLHSVPEESDRGARLIRGEDGAVIYDPTASEELTDLLVDQTLIDTFNYEVIDTFGGKALGSVTITVTGVRPFPSTEIVLPPTQFTTVNLSTPLIPFTVDHPTLDPSLLTVSARSLRPEIVADDQIVLAGSGNNRSVQITPTADQSGRVPIQLTVAAPNGDFAGGIFQLFVGTESDQDLDGVSNAEEDAGANSGDANGDGIPDRLQAHVLSIAAGLDFSRIVVSVPDGAYLQDVSLDAAPAASGVAESAVLPLGLLRFSVDLPSGDESVDMTVSTDFNAQPINTAYFYAENTPESQWQHLMRNSDDGVRVYADRLEVKGLDGGRTDNGTAGDGYVTHAIALASLENPWQNGRPLDVNNDGVVQPIDALIVINDLNRNSIRDLPRQLGDGDRIPSFFDVSGDRKITPIDALIVINWLNRNPGGAGGEGEIGGETFHQPVSANTFSLAKPWDQDMSDEERRLRLAIWDATLNQLT